MMKKWLRLAAGRLWKDIKDYRMFILAFTIYGVSVQLCFHAFCPMVIITGIPCPGCGMTRAVFYFAAGRFKEGWTMNPLGVLWLVLAAYFAVMRYWLGKRAKGVLQVGGILAFCMLIFYGYRMFCFFPNDPPVCYYPGNLLERIIPGYREFVLQF